MTLTSSRALSLLSSSFVAVAAMGGCDDVKDTQTPDGGAFIDATSMDVDPGADVHKEGLFPSPRSDRHSYCHPRRLAGSTAVYMARSPTE